MIEFIASFVITFVACVFCYRAGRRSMADSCAILICENITESMRAYDAGWIAASKWADRDDLIADMDSEDYLVERRDAVIAGVSAQHG